MNPARRALLPLAAAAAAFLGLGVAAVALPEAAHADNQFTCRVPVDGGGYMDMVVTAIASRTSRADYQIDMYGHGENSLLLRYDQVVDGKGAVYRGVTGHLAPGQWKRWFALDVYRKGAFIKAAVVDEEGDGGFNACYI